MFKNLLPSIGDKVSATKDDTTIEKDKAIAVSLNKVPAIPSMKINGINTEYFKISWWFPDYISRIYWYIIYDS